MCASTLLIKLGWSSESLCLLLWVIGITEMESDCQRPKMVLVIYHFVEEKDEPIGAPRPCTDEEEAIPLSN